MVSTCQLLATVQATQVTKAVRGRAAVARASLLTAELSRAPGCEEEEENVDEEGGLRDISRPRK